MTLTCRFPMHKDQVKAICILHVYHSSKNEPYPKKPTYSSGIFGAVLICEVFMVPWEWSLDDIHLGRKPRMTNLLCFDS